MIMGVPACLSLPMIGHGVVEGMSGVPLVEDGAVIDCSIHLGRREACAVGTVSGVHGGC